MADKLILQDVGLAAINNANAGGVLVRPTFFKGGNSGLYPLMENATDILGELKVQGKIHHVEVLSTQSVRFFFELDGRAVSEATEIKELGIFLDDNIMLGRCVFEEPIILVPNELFLISLLMTTTRGDLSVISVAIGEYESIPITPFFYRLPTPYDTQFNAIIVANGIRNVDGSDTPVVAMRYGEGAFQWGFTGHTRVYANFPASGDTTSFTISSSTNFDDHELVIVHVVDGTGEGQTRRFYYDEPQNKFIEADGVATLDMSQCKIAIWKATGIGATFTQTQLPSRPAGAPEDWVLLSGNGDSPVWGPQKSGAKVLNTLYTPPSRLDTNVLNYIGTGDSARFSLGDLRVENANYLYPALGGVTQHRSAFDVNASELEFAEVIPAGVPIDLRVFTKVSSTGTRLAFTSDHYVGDGATTRFAISTPVTDTKFVFVYMQGALQNTTGYSIDTQTQEIVFTEPPIAGLPITFRAFSQISDTGYSTRIISQSYMITGETLFLSLPLTPQSKEQVFLSHSGTHVHDDLYTIVEDQLVLSGSLAEGVEVEVLIFDNILAQGSENTNLKGIVYDGFLTYKSLKLLRHGSSPITLPIPAPNFEAGDGIRLTGQYPNIRIENTFSKSASLNPFKRHGTLHTEKNANQILATYRINLSGDSLILVVCDFSAKLGPGFSSPEGMENIEFVVGMRSVNTREPEYGRQILGTGEAGFSSLNSDNSQVAYSNASLSRVFEIVKNNHPAGYVDVVAKMRVNNANISQFGSKLSINVSVIEIPKWDTA